MKLLKKLSALEFHQLIWILPCLWALHEAEEWNIIPWYERFWVNVPPMKPVVVWTGLVLMSLVGFAWTLIGTLPRNNVVAAFVALPFFTILAFGNALQHIYFVFKFGSYAPGVITAFVLIIPATLYMTFLALNKGLMPWWCVIAIYLPNIPQMFLTIQTGNEMPAIVRTLYRFSDSLTRLLFG
jgi:hypothetical protein